MTRHLDPTPGLAQHTVPVDQEGAAVHAQVFLAVELLQLDHVEQLAERLVLVADQLEGEALLGLEVLVRLEPVARDAEHHRVGRREGVELVTKALALGGAAGRAVLGVEVQHHLATLERRQRDGLASGGLGGEVRNGLIDLDGHGRSLHRVLRAPGFDQRIQVEGVGEVQELVAQPADLRAGRQDHGERGVEHAAAGLRCQVGIAGHGIELDAVVEEELAQFADDVGAIGRADVGDVRQRLRAHFQIGAAYHVEGERMLLAQAGQAGFQARQGVPAAADLQHQCAGFTMSAQARADHGAAIVESGLAQYVGQHHGIGAQGADDEKLFADGGGGHATFLKRWAVGKATSDLRVTGPWPMHEGLGAGSGHRRRPGGPDCTEQRRKGSENRRPGECSDRHLRLYKPDGASTITALFFRQEQLHDCGQYGGIGHTHGCARAS